jgi:4-carboxymuconolactone decarboxylase
MGRPGLDLATREILNVALLSATDFTLQLHSHLRGALRAGVDPGLLRVVLLAATEHLPAARREDHLRRLEALVARGRAGPRGTR